MSGNSLLYYSEHFRHLLYLLLITALSFAGPYFTLSLAYDIGALSPNPRAKILGKAAKSLRMLCGSPGTGNGHFSIRI